MLNIVKSRKLSVSRQEEITAFLFILPFILGYLCFTIFPVISTALLSFSNFNTLNGLSHLKFNGLQNYFNIFKDEIALSSFLRTFWYSVVFVLTLTFIPLMIAVLLNKKFFGRKLTRTLILMPYITNVVAVSIVMLVIFNPYDGVVNFILRAIGIANPPMWFGGTISLTLVALVHMWHGSAFQTIVYLAALQDVPRELYESGDIDGTTGWSKFWHITLPMVSPTIFMMLVTCAFEAFSCFNYVKLLSDGGPGMASRTIALNIYETAFEFNRYAYAAAQSMLVFVIVFIITVMQWKGQKKWVHYQI